MSATPPRRRAIDALVARDQTAVFWFVVAIVIAGVCAWYADLMSRVYAHRPPFVVMDTAGAYYIPPGIAYRDMHDMHEQLTELALETILERDKDGFIYPERLPKLFTKPAQDKLLDHFSSEAQYFRSQNATQTFQIEKIYYIDRKTKSLATEATGIARRVSFLDGNRLESPYRFKIALGWRANESIEKNQAYPSVIVDIVFKEFSRLNDLEAAQMEAAVAEAEALRATEAEVTAAKARARADEAAAAQAEAVEAIRKATQQ
jgi:hypothetical protein